MVLPERILVVEDVKLESKRLEDLLQDSGYIVEIVETGEQALQYLCATHQLPNLIITDVVMPGISGFDLCRMIKAEELFAPIPIILLTGLNEPTAVISGLQCGATNFIHKPYDVDFFLERIRSVLKTQEYRLGDKTNVDKVYYAGREYLIDCDNSRVLDLLLSTYEHAYRQNRELMATRDELRKANKSLEEAVAKRTEDFYESEKSRLISEGLVSSINASDFLVLLTLNSSGMVLRANNAASDFFGIPKVQLEGVCLDELTGLEREFKDHIKTCIKSGTDISEIDFCLQTASRGELWGSATLSNTCGSEDSRGSVFVIIRNITERKVSERELESSRMGLIVTLNQLAEAITKVTDLKNYDVRIELPHHPFCHDVNQCNNDQCPQFGSDSYRCWEIDVNGEVVCDKRLMNYCQLEPSKCRYYNDIMSEPLNHIQELFNCMMDILQSGHKQLEDAYNELSHTRVQSLQQEKMASIGQLAAGVAHEINNPVGFVASNLDTLKKYIDRFETFFRDASSSLKKNGSLQVNEELMASFEKNKIDSILKDLPKLVSECIDGTDRVTRIVNDLKTFSRTDDDTFDYVDLNSCIDSTLNIVWNEIKYSAELVKDYGELPLLYANGHKLAQVFMNLVVNAAHAIKEQGEITIQTRQDGSKVVVVIEDNGCGIPPDIQSKIFEPFFTTKEVGKGTGLGMSVVYDILQKHDATIDLLSTVGKGTRFTLSFPAEQNKDNKLANRIFL